MNGSADSEIARRLRQDGVPLGELFSFMSGLYFRGKLAYARAFAAAPRDLDGAFVITAVAVWCRRARWLHCSDCGKFLQAACIPRMHATGYRSIVMRKSSPKPSA